MKAVRWRTQRGIEDDMIAAFLTLVEKDVNDVNEGSVLRAFFKVMAAEHEETDFNIAAAAHRSSLRFATGVDLDLLGDDEGLARHSSSGASGNIRLTRSSPQPGDSSVAAIGSIVLSNGSAEYSNTQPCRIFNGATSWVVDDGVYSNNDIPFSASTSGVDTNTGANTITILVTAPDGVEASTNPSLFSGGRIAESDRDFRARIKYERDRRAGGSRVAILAEALRQQDVYSAAVYEWTVVPSGSKYVKPSPGEIWVYAFEAFPADQVFAAGRLSNTPATITTLSPDNLTENLRNSLEIVRGFPVTMKVYEAYAVLVSPIITLTISKSYRLSDTAASEAEIAQRIRNYILQLKIGESLSQGHVFAIAGRVIPFKEASVSFVVYRNRTHDFSEEIDSGLIEAELDEIIKPYGSYLNFGTITIQTED